MYVKRVISAAICMMCFLMPVYGKPKLDVILPEVLFPENVELGNVRVSDNRTVVPIKNTILNNSNRSEIFYPEYLSPKKNAQTLLSEHSFTPSLITAVDVILNSEIERKDIHVKLLRFNIIVDHSASMKSFVMSMSLGSSGGALGASLINQLALIHVSDLVIPDKKDFLVGDVVFEVNGKVFRCMAIKSIPEGHYYDKYIKSELRLFAPKLIYMMVGLIKNDDDLFCIKEYLDIDNDKYMFARYDSSLSREVLWKYLENAPYLYGHATIVYMVAFYPLNFILDRFDPSHMNDSLMTYKVFMESVFVRDEENNADLIYADTKEMSNESE